MSDDTEPVQTEAQYKKDMALLRKVMATLDSSTVDRQGLTLVLHTILDTLGQGFGGLLLVSDPQRPGLEVVAHRSLPAGEVAPWIFSPGCACKEVLHAGVPILVQGCSTCGAYSRGGPQSLNHLVVPLKARRRPVGTLCLLCPTGSGVEGWSLGLWEDIGVQIGRAVEDVRLHAQIQQERELLHTLYAVSNHLATSLDLDWVLSRVLDLSILATNARDGSIFMLPRPGSSSARVLRRDLPPAEAEMVIQQVLSQGMAGWVMRHKEGLIISDVATDSRWLSLPDDPSQTGSALAVPLMAGGRVQGILTLDHAQPAHFHSRHMALMTAIAHQASTAIEKARLYREVTHLAGVLAQRVEEQTQELKATQAQLIQAEKLAALGELAAGISHEINNPLHALQVYIEYLSSHAAMAGPVQETLVPMHDALESIARLAGQLRDFSRPAEGEWRPVDINRALATVLRLAAKELSHRHIQVVNAGLTAMPLVKGDTRQLEQVFLNLLLNARDAMPGGGQLTIETQADADQVYVRFKDTGVGIQEENLQRIFEPYFTTKADRGTGLGLAICRRIVVQHGGKILVVSKVGQGSVFTVCLPIMAGENTTPPPLHEMS